MYKEEQGTAIPYSSDLKIATIFSTTIILGSPLYAIMNWKEVPAKELLNRAEANGYKYGAYQTEDNTKDNTRYVKKTLKD